MDMHDYHYYQPPPSYYNKANDRNPCSESQFRCGNNVCIPLHLRCDGFYHCNDLTDESGCDEREPQYNRPMTQRPPANVVRTTTATPRRNSTYWSRPTQPATTSRPTTTISTTTTTPAPSRSMTLKNFKFRKRKKMERVKKLYHQTSVFISFSSSLNPKIFSDFLFSKIIKKLLKILEICHCSAFNINTLIYFFAFTLTLTQNNKK